MELPPKGTVQNNFARVLVVDPVNLSGLGTIAEQLCVYILNLPVNLRTIQATDSKWNIALGKSVYEIINRGKGTITELAPVQLLLIKDANLVIPDIGLYLLTEKIVKNEKPLGLINNVNPNFVSKSSFIIESLEVFLNGMKMTKLEDYNTSGYNNINLKISPGAGEIITINYIKN